MEEAQDAYSSENESRGMDVHLGIEGSNSNGHGEEKYKEVSMMNLIIFFQKDVQIHEADNERIKKVKEQQEDFNMKLMHILEIIENKLDKESGSRKSGSHRTPDEKIRTRSVSRHHQHSPRHSNKRAHNKSSPSPVRKHKRSGWMSYEGK
jgi:hypothetical protein